MKKIKAEAKGTELIKAFNKLQKLDVKQLDLVDKAIGSVLVVQALENADMQGLAQALRS